MDESGTARVTVEEAARLLGIERSSVKKRIQRGKLRSEKDASGTIWVELDESETVRDESTNRSETVRDELVDELRDRIRSLEGRLDDERESRRRSDTIIAQLTQANTALNERLVELEAPARDSVPDQGPPEASESVADGAGGPLAPAMGTGASEAAVEPGWMQSRWANWVISSTLGAVIAWLLPFVIAAAGAIYVYVTAVSGDTLAAVLSAVASLIGFVLSLYFNATRVLWKRQAEQRGAHIEETYEGLREVHTDVRDLKEDIKRRNDWYEERMKREPELDRRVKEIWEEYER